MKHFFYILLFLLTIHSKSQTLKVFVYFSDKDTNGFNPYAFFDSKALERRITQHLPLYDYSDIPVNANYVRSVMELADSILMTSRWLNMAVVFSDAERISKIERLPYVKYVEMYEDVFEGGICEGSDLFELHQGERNLLAGQTQYMKAGAFKNKGLTGKGVRIAIIDAGFKGLRKSKTLTDLTHSNRIKKTWDFIKKAEDVEKSSTHGTVVLSCIAGRLDSVPMGMAPDAEFLLFRTEKAFSEKIREEELWLAAAEMADQNGADIINTSLGYTTTRYFRKDMDGRSSILSKAARIASKKGILVVCSAGNEGDNTWKIVATPADSDSVLAVGGINPWTGIQASWSSYGPSADKRVKPNVSAYGYVIGDDGMGEVEPTMGTSFSSPLVVGFAACVIQQHKDWDVMTLLHEIEKSGDLYPYYDYAHGYGVPQATYFTGEKKSQTQPTFTIRETSDSLHVILSDEFFNVAQIPVPGYFSREVEQKTRIEDASSWHFYDQNYTESTSAIFKSEPGYFYYHMVNEKNYLSWYFVLSVRQPNVLSMPLDRFEKGAKLEFYYKGYLQSWTY